ncbi:MAG: DedA family protein [Polyangiaceae bacterium]
MDDPLLHGSLGLIFVWLLSGGLGAPLPEDAALLAAGALAHRGVIPLMPTVVVCFVGVLLGDALLFFGARRIGPAIYERRVLRRWLTPERRAKIVAAFERHGAKVVFVARHLGGLRSPIFAMAAIHGVPTLRFFAWDALSACISVPVMLGIGYVASDHLMRVRAGMAHVEHYLLLGAIALVVGYLGSTYLRRRPGGGRHRPEH